MGQWGNGAMGPWGMGTGIKKNYLVQTMVTYLGRYIQAQVPQCM